MKVIEASGLSKAYRIGQFSSSTLSEDFSRIWAKLRSKEDPMLKLGQVNDRTKEGTSNIVWSLQDVSFSVDQGDALGIIGKNGAGKSTLLKLLSKVTSPTTGVFRSKGRIASLLEVGTGFHPELTGRENVFLNGSILGMKRKEIERKFEEIVEFSGVQRYIDTPVKRYSSGMYVRLAFAVAAHLDSEILILDEVLAVGDSEFQKKCIDKMAQVTNNEGRTVLFVSHNLNSVKNLCNKALVLSQGKSIYQGSIDEGLALYRSTGIESSQNPSEYSGTFDPDKEISILSAKLVNHSGVSSDVFQVEEGVVLDIEYQVNRDLKDSIINFYIRDDSFDLTTSFDTDSSQELLELRKKGKYITRVTLPSFTLKPGRYYVNIGSGIINKKSIEHIENALSFEVYIGDGNEKVLSYSKNRSGLFPIVPQWQTQMTENSN